MHGRLLRLVQSGMAKPTPRRTHARRALAGTLAALLMGAAGGAAAQTSGIVVRVIDGDSLVLRPAGGGKPVEVRIQDIDAPEACQVWGAEAKKALEDLALTQTAVLRTSGTDSYGRTLARVMVGDVDLGPRLVESGHAWSAQGRNGRGPLMKQQRVAQALNRGLWAAPPVVMPRDFRRAHGPCKLPP
jgi:endonuclease YncB( thermonuclease family)